MTNEHALLEQASHYGRDYLETLETRPVFPSTEAVADLAGFDEPLPEHPQSGSAVLEQLHRLGSPGTVASAGPNYYGFVIGATLPVAGAAERLALVWDQCASTDVNSPTAYAIEQTAARWVLDILDLPSESSVGFGTSATACAFSVLAAARQQMLKRAGWDLEQYGLAGAPPIRVVCPATLHITLHKVLRLLGIGRDQIHWVPCDDRGRVRLDVWPDVDALTLVCLQAGEVNTGEFDPFATLIPRARAAGAWVHVDGAFGLWARATDTHRHLTDGVELADSWTVDAHKWLNTPYDGAMGICRHASAVAEAMNSDADYARGDPMAQKNLTLEFSRRARGIPVWAALKHLGRSGVAAMVERHCALARRIANGLAAAGYTVLNEGMLNQVLVRAETDDQTRRITEAAQTSGAVWFGPSMWRGRPAFRISVSSWRTEERHADHLVALLTELKRSAGG